MSYEPLENNKLRIECPLKYCTPENGVYCVQKACAWFMVIQKACAINVIARKLPNPQDR